MEEFLYFHDFAIVVLVFILGLVTYMLLATTVAPSIQTGLLERQGLEAL